ncbi:trafficking protein particle complex subunit 9 [Sarotherodon galilaeus]
MTLPLTDPALTKLGKQTLKHRYVVSPQVPVNLMGRDLLIKLGATIMCSADGLLVTLPGGTKLPCLETNAKNQYLMQNCEPPPADIYWGRLVEEGILGQYQQWKPWIMSLAVYSSPRDPYHVTLFYDRDDDDVYREAFQSELEGQTWNVQTQNIYAGPEGVGAVVKLTDEQLPWYNMGSDSAPHITLAVYEGHQAKELGTMVKRALDNAWWQPTQVPNVCYAPKCKTYRITCVSSDTVILEHQQISRTHGSERTDHPDAVAELSKLPDTLWSTGPTDVGLAHCSPVLFQLKSETPISRPQYKHKPDAEEGIAETIEGLLEAGVLEPAQSLWNTPILPVEKHGTGKYRMAHDLRAINAILHTDTVPVPNPYTALTEITWDQKGRQFRYTRLPQGFALSPGIFNQVLKEALSPCQLPEGCTLTQYVDDLLIAAPSAAACTAASLTVLKRLSECGFKRLSKVLDAPNLTFTHEGINMADLMGSGEPHDCVKKAEVEGKVREDLKAEPISGAEDWFTDGCCHRDEEGLKAGYAIVCKQGTEFEVKEAGRIEGQQSAQRAEVIALSRALRLAKDKRVNIYTDSAYAFGAAHVELLQWKRAGFRTATNAPICHRKEIEELERALHDPSEVSIIKCKGNSQANTMVAKGNQKADEAAKEAAGYKGRQQMVQVTAEEEAGINMLEEARQAQEEASFEEKEVWQSKGARKEGGLWRGADGRPVLTDKLARQKITEAHGLGHVGVAQMERNLCHWWHPDLTAMIREKARTCLICGAHNPKPVVKPEAGFTPHELQTGRPFPAPWTEVPAEHTTRSNRSHAEYWDELKCLVSSFTKQVTSGLHTVERVTPEAKVVWLKVIKRKWKEPRWTGPYEVIARTTTAVQLKGKGDTWYHWSQCAPAHESLIEENSSLTNTGGNEQRQNKSSHLCNGPTSSPPGRPKKEEEQHRRSPRQQKGVNPITLSLGPWSSLPKSESPGGVFYLVIGVDVSGTDPFGVKTIPQHNTRTLAARRKRHILAKRGTQTIHAYDPRLNSPTWIDSIGVPRGVPDEYKLADQVASGFESIFLWVMPNKNVDRINYVHYNLLRLSNLTRDAMEGFAEQLGPSSLMGVQNRMALDMLLAEKGGVCAMFGDMCCTFIPNNTAPDGSVTRALEGLKTLSKTMHEHSGIKNPLESWMTSVFGRWKGLAMSVMLSLATLLGILVIEPILRTHDRSELLQDVIQFALRGLVLSIHGSRKLLQDLIRAALNEPILRTHASSYRFNPSGQPCGGHRDSSPSRDGQTSLMPTFQMPKPPQLAPFDVEEQRLYSVPLPHGRTSHPISRVEASHPSEEAHFRLMYSRSHSFSHYPQLVAIAYELSALGYVFENYTTESADTVSMEMGFWGSNRRREAAERNESCSIQSGMDAVSPNKTRFPPEGLPIIYEAHIVSGTPLRQLAI